jgi:hypothetical protein
MTAEFLPTTSPRFFIQAADKYFPLPLVSPSTSFRFHVFRLVLAERVQVVVVGWWRLNHLGSSSAFLDSPPSDRVY